MLVALIGIATIPCTKAEEEMDNFNFLGNLLSITSLILQLIANNITAIPKLVYF